MMTGKQQYRMGGDGTTSRRMISRVAIVLLFAVFACATDSSAYQPGQSGAQEYLYKRAWKLRMNDQFQEAYDTFASFLEKDDGASPLLEIKADWMMGNLQVRMGNIVRAREHFKRGMPMWDPLFSNIVNEEDRLDLVRSKTLMLGAYAGVEASAGYLSHSRKLIEEMRVLNGEGTRLSNETIRSANADGRRVHTKTIAANQEAEFLYATGSAKLAFYAARFDASRKWWQRAIDSPRSQSIAYSEGNALFGLLQLEMLLENAPEILRLVDRISKVPKDPQYPTLWNDNEVLQIFITARSEGVTPALLKAEQTASERFGNNQYLALLLALAGQYDEARAVSDAAIKAAREGGRQMQLAALLCDRWEICMDRPDDGDVGVSLFESLMLYRDFGLKIYEPKLYYRYACFCLAAGQPETARLTFEQGFDLSERLGLPNYSFRMLLGLAACFENLNDPVGAAIARRRAEQYRGQHSGLLATLDSEMAWLFQLPHTVPPATSLAASASQLSADESSSVQEAPSATAPPVVMAPPATPQRIILQPRSITTCVLPGESARTRFALVNAEGQPIDGVLRLLAPQHQVQWSEDASGWTASIAMTGQSNSPALPISLPADQLSFITLEMEADFGECVTNTIHFEGNPGLEGTWEVSLSDNQATVAVMEASHIERNPFYTIPFYHEFRSRSSDGPVLRNLRIVTSRPCRVELASLTQQRFIALDANGNGSFDDVGDDLYVDADHNGSPDITIAAPETPEVLQILVFPAIDDGLGSVDVGIYTDEKGTWQLQAVDSITTTPEME
ncbi:MAG: hypothetical protein PF904_14105 [Kiritimatiellae bacterium]|jgi:tetratricopeptide (TPR) repeat protein|nr:hypothetical protein [Kiritimatiellia bacterium]